MPCTPPAPDDNARLFLTLWPSPGLRAALLDHQRAWQWTPASAPVRAQNLHLTLHFIGPVPRDRLAELSKALEVPFTPFELAFGLSDVWPSGIAVLQPNASSEGLLALHEALAQALQRLELLPERRTFRPHVTLARHAAGAMPPAEQPVLRWPVRDYALVESVAGQYRLLQRYTSAAGLS